MDKCGFSEFTYGYCVTEDLIVGKKTKLTAAPVFPSLIEEGKPGKGYDLHLERPGAPLFLQFKLVQQMVRSRANEAQQGHLTTPFYRMYLRPKALSDQHASLLSLEQAGNDVYYVAPGFHTKSDLNAAYAQRQVWDRSFRLKPSAIGPLPDDKKHHVSFKNAPGAWRLYSETPTREGNSLSTEDITSALRTRITQKRAGPSGSRYRSSMLCFRTSYVHARRCRTAAAWKSFRPGLIRLNICLSWLVSFSTASCSS